MANKDYLKSLMIMASVVILQPAHAYDFAPTDTEWLSWPGYCQAKYIWTPIGQDSKFIDSVGSHQKEELARWEDAGMYGVHHFCAGKVWFERAKTQNSADDRAFMLEQAWSETAFTANRSDRTAPLFTEITLLQATILFEKNETEKAIQVLQRRIEEHPLGDVLYSATAVMQRRLGQLNQAKATLLQGNDATDGNSAEINYNLGLISLELGNIDDARVYADRAYRLGYPLPGLQVKLARLGRR